MTLQLDLKPEMERSLRAEADARHIPLETYVLSLVESSLASSFTPPAPPPPTKIDLDAWFAEMAQFSHKIPDQPGETWSRETLYDDHD